MRLFATILAGCAAAALNCPTSAVATPPSAATAAVERFPHISVKAIGEGPAVVLIPGLSTPRELWSGVVPALQRHHRVILVQVNGFAGDDPGANLSPGVLLGIEEDLHAYVAAHHLGPVRLVGHSMGGLAALSAAAHHPEDVASLMIVDALPFAGVMFDEHATVDAVRPLAEMLKAKLSAGYSGEKGAAEATANAKALTAKPESAAAVRNWVLAANPKVAAEAMAEDLTTDLRADLPSITAPITLVHPATAFGKDEKATAAFYRAQYAGAKRVNFVAVPGAGHFVMLDQPKAFAAALADFVK